jgi:hypothetical protein
VEQVVERHAPGFTSAIHQQLLFSSLPGLGRADTPVDRPYLAGASAHPGGAVHGGRGLNAARAALARAGHGDALYHRAACAPARPDLVLMLLLRATGCPEFSDLVGTVTERFDR